MLIIGCFMREKIYISKYVMQSRQGLNSRSHTTRHEGALLRVDAGGVSGYSCLHPWQELGDTSLDELLLELKDGRMSRQVSCALHCAEVDREARAKGVSLFDGLDVPDSHATIVGGIDRVEIAVAEGFDTVKLKMGRDVDSDISFVREINEAFPELRLRLDFNGVLGAGRIEYFVREVGEGIRNQIDFLEDPCRLGDPIWEEIRDRYAVKTAVDRGIEGAGGEYDYAVVKPAINHTGQVCDTALRTGHRVVVTSYMDHPLGQCFAAYCAGKMNKRYLGLIDKRAGLMTHGLYQPTAYTERLGEKSPTWKSPEGTGLGFDDLLEKESWERLV